MNVIPDKTTGYLRILLNNLSLKSNYSRYLSSPRKILIVEGKTDLELLKPYLIENVDCEIAAYVLSSNQSFEVPRSSIKFNCKEAIVQIIVGLAQFPPSFLPNCPPEVKNWNIYGMVDLDNEAQDIYQRISKLFWTDTSDIETLILSTDHEILTRLEGLKLTTDEIDRCFMLAYQFAQIKNALIRQISSDDIPIEQTLKSSADIFFGDFMVNDVINVHDLLKYLCTKGKLKLSKERIKKICQNAINNDYVLKKNVDKQTFDWKAKQIRNNPTDLPNFWNTVNGHIIINFLKYINREVFYKYAKDTTNGLDRNFELDLIKKYDSKKFYTTLLFKKMYQAQLLKQA